MEILVNIVWTLRYGKLIIVLWYNQWKS